MLVKKLPTIPPVTAMGEKAPVTNGPQHRRDATGVENHHAQRQHHIQQRHEGHESFRYAADALEPPSSTSSESRSGYADDPAASSDRVRGRHP